ncbi:MAG: NADP-dependent 3-hydroxy acid dehydrogenase YdfG [Glaciecola sp.]|jgi:NADP-dependent 3-hydroxy acid dehydrogenase YdfG
MNDITGKVVAITGGAQGIGAATAALLVSRGAKVGLGDLDLELATATAKQLGPAAMASHLDVTQADSVSAFLDAVEGALGPIDVLINNAGVMFVGAFTKESEATTDLLIDVNVRGVINGCKAVLPRFEDRGHGHIVNVASMAGRVAPALLATYSATKHAVIGLTDALRNEYSGAGIQVSAIMPNVVNTRLGSGTARNIVKPLEATDVAEVIAKVITTRQNQSSVPPWLGPVSELLRPLGSRARLRMEKLSGRDRTFAKGELSKRRDYERDLLQR